MARPSYTIAATLFFSLISFAQPGHAQGLLAERVEKRLLDAANKIEMGCANELRQYCSSVTPGEGRLIFCIMAHEEKIGEKCEYTLYEASQNLAQAISRIAQTAANCEEDIQKVCTAAPLGGGGIARCLISNKSSLTGACRTAIGELLVDK